MKWNDLTLKERKRIYDSVKSNNPDITYLELKEQFDNIPAYEDGIAIIDSNTDYVKWKKSLPNNLKNESYGYDLYGAYKSKAIPTLSEDNTYHLPSRDPNTGRILKYPSHDTFYTAITEDIKQGYYPISKGNNTYTIPVNPKEEYSIYRYEDGKEREEPKRTSPVSWTEDDRLFEMRKDSILRKVKRMEQDHPLEPKYYTTKSTKSKRKKLSDSNLFGVFNGLKAFDNELDKKISQSGDDIKEAAVKTNEEKYEKTKQGLNAAGILAQAGLAFTGSAAGAMGYGNLSNLIGASQSIWNAYELANSIDENDNLGIIQNSIPLALYGAGITKYIPRVNQMRGVDAISKIGNTSGLVWDWLPNPIIEAFKIKRDRKIQK